MGAERIPHSRPTRVEGDLDAVRRVLESGHLAAGPETRAFEAEVAKAAGRAWGVATSSGFTALQLALLAGGVGAGDRVALPSYVCAALLQAVRGVRAEEVLVDSAAGSVNLDPEMVEPARVRAVIVPHLLGEPAPMARLRERLLGTNGLLIEDCAMAAGARADGRVAGGWGDLAIFSFYATKMATCGQGGMVLGDDPALEARARDLLDYDNRDDFELRFNWQLTDLQAAVGRVQWGRIEEFVARRRALARIYDAAIDGAAVTNLGGHRAPQADPPGGRSACFRYCVDLGGSAAREFVSGRMNESGVEAKSPIYKPLHRTLGLDDRRYPRAGALQDGLLSIPIYPALSDGQAERVATGLNAAVRAALDASSVRACEAARSKP